MALNFELVRGNERLLCDWFDCLGTLELARAFGCPKVLGEVQELARQYAPTVIVELARLALRAKNESARIAAIRELLDRGYGRPRQAMEISAPAGDPLQLMLEEIDALSRKTDRYKQYPIGVDR